MLPMLTAKVDVAAEIGDVVPRIAWLGNLIVPAGGRSWPDAGYQRALPSTWLIQRVIDFANFERITCTNRHIAETPVRPM